MDILTTQSLEICVVKRCLVNSISTRLNVNQRKRFIDYIDECTDIASRMARWASLAFLYYVVRRQEMGLKMPDFGKVTDGYWIQWMRTGLHEFGTPTYPTLMPSAKYKGQSLQSDECKKIDEHIFLEIDDLLGNTLAPSTDSSGGKQAMRTIPKYFDRIVGHMAKQFSTAVENALTVNFFEKLKRVCRYEVENSGVKDFTSYDLLLATCNEKSEKVLPEELRSFVDGVREALGLVDKPSVVIYENSTFAFPLRFAVHWFLQARLAVFGKRKLMLSPVHKVQRQHIRLDATHLGLIINDILWTPEAERVAKMKPDTLSKCPTHKTHPELSLYKVAKLAWAAQKSTYDEQYRAYKEAKDKLGTSPLSKIASQKTEDPEASLIIDIPLPTIKKPEDLEKDDPKWTKEIRPEMQRLRDKAINERSLRRMSPEFKDDLKKYKDYEVKVRSFALSLFNDFQDRNPKLGWKPSGSVMTDSVSLCVTYVRTITKANRTCDEELEEFVAKKRAKKKANKDALDLDPSDDYDAYANTCFGDALVLGIDPGRVCIVTIVCIDAQGVKTSWRLTRGQFHTESGILKQNKVQSRRYKPLVEDFASLTACGGALRASSSEEIRKYIIQYRKFEDKWFTDFALQKRESRAKIKRFMGKQKTMASFFSRVRKEAEIIMHRSGKTRIEVAYGACGPTMASTGRGELAVPTKGAYGACIRAFTKERESDGLPNKIHNVVSLENEDFTSQICWYTKNAYEKVYKKYDADGKEFLHHTTGKRAPVVKDNENEAFVLSKRADNKLKAKKQRGGGGLIVPLAPPESAKDAQKTRHIDVRGLLFCQERRMFFNRDNESARAIAGLRCIRLSGLGRPTAFRRKKRTAEKASTTTFGGSPISREGGCDLPKSQPEKPEGAACTPCG